jgi:hypothetical protein
MTEKTLRKDVWEAAGYAGLALGLVSVAYMYIGNILNTSGLSAGVVTLITVPLWIAKFVGCILLMKFFMKKFHSAHPGISDKDLFRMGAVTALLSAFFFASLQFVDMTYLSAEFYAEQYEVVMQQYSSLMDSNSLSMIKKFMDVLPQFTFVWTLIYCTVYGTVLSSILSRNIPSKDPFADYKPE